MKTLGSPRLRTMSAAAQFGQREAVYSALKRHGVPLGLALMFGAALRLLWIDDASFLDDQANLLALGHSAADYHALIITGKLNSIGSITFPAPAWLYAPFALLGGPVAASAFTALLNVLAVGLLYALGARYGGRRAGFVAAMLYATASVPVRFSRFIWEPNLLAPCIVLLLGTILAGLVERRTGWLGWAALFWGIAFQLHLTAGALILMIAFALLFTWRDVRRRDLLWAGAALAALFAPAVLWEVASHGFDLTIYQNLGPLKPVIDASAPLLYADVISPAPPSLYGPGSSYAAIGAALRLLAPLMEILAFVSGIWLTAITISPWMSGWRSHGGWRAMIAITRWRVAALLFLWQVLPMLLMLRHTVGVQAHYLFMLLPIVYLTIGLWAAAASHVIEGWLARRGKSTARLAPVGLTVLTLALGIAQTAGVAAELITVHSGQFSGIAWPLNYGIPLSSEESTLAAAGRIASQEKATLYIAATTQQQDAYAYLAQTGATHATVYVSDNCLITPTYDSAHPMVTLALPGTQAIEALPTLTGDKALGTLSAQGSQPLALYLSQPGSGLRNEAPLPALTTATGPRPAAYSYTTSGASQTYLTIRWTGASQLTESPEKRAVYWFGSAPDGPLVANYIITAQRLDSAGQPLGAPLSASCGRLPWQDGTDLLAWLPLPSTAPEGATKWRISLSAAPAEALRPQIGPIALETGEVTFSQPQIIAGPFIIETTPGS